MEENNEKKVLYSNQINNIISTINYILSLWDNIKKNELKGIEKKWKSKDSDFFI